MYPVLLRIHDFELTSFGAMVAIAALVGLWLLQREAFRAGLPSSVIDVGVAGLVGGLLGAKLLWTIEFRHDGPWLGLLLSRSGLSWFGGLLGGVVAGLWLMWRRHLAIVDVFSAAAPGLAVGHAIGRIGCFLVGDDYGKPSDLPWAVAFPDGRPPTLVRVHPTQLYETVALLVVAGVLIGLRRRGMASARVFGVYLLLAGSVRFVIEFVRVNAIVLGPFTLAQLIAMGVMLTGVAFVLSGGTPARRVRTTRGSGA